MKFLLPQSTGLNATALRILSIAVFLGGSGVLMAQSSLDTNSGPPPGPLLKRTPDHSAWSVTIQGSPEADSSADKNSAGSSGGATDQNSVVVSQSTVMKSGDTIYEQNKGSDGRVYQIWHIKGLRVEKGSDGTPIVAPDSGGGDIYSVNFLNSDFAGLDWIAADTYQGKTGYQGRDVLIFKQNVNPNPADERHANDIADAVAKANNNIRAMKGLPLVPIATSQDNKLVPALATIDLQSRLPLLLTIGGEKRTYQYAPLTTSIPMPPEISSAVSDYEKKLKLLSQ